MPESLGKILKKFRESKNLSLEEVSEKTRIPKKIICTIEEDRVREISSEFYAKGFVKSYSQFLGALEEKPIKEYLSGIKKKEAPVLTLKSESEKAREDWFRRHKKHIGIGILVVFSIWLFLFSVLQIRKFVKNVFYRHRERVSEVRSRSHTPTPSPREKKVEGAAADKETAKRQGIELEIAARSDTWLQVTSDGKLSFRGILKKGEKDIWLADREIKLGLGNARGVVLKFNGKDIDIHGKRGEKKELIITKDGVKF